MWKRVNGVCVGDETRPCIALAALESALDMKGCLHFTLDYVERQAEIVRTVQRP